MTDGPEMPELPKRELVPPPKLYASLTIEQGLDEQGSVSIRLHDFRRGHEPGSDKREVEIIFSRGYVRSLIAALQMYQAGNGGGSYTMRVPVEQDL